MKENRKSAPGENIIEEKRRKWHQPTSISYQQLAKAAISIMKSEAYQPSSEE